MDTMANDYSTVSCLDFKTYRHLFEQELIDVYSSQLYDYRIALELVYPNHTIRTGLIALDIRSLLK